MCTVRSSIHRGRGWGVSTRHPPGPDTPREQTPPGADTPLWTEFWTHAYENITLLQTSFAGGKYYDFLSSVWESQTRSQK